MPDYSDPTPARRQIAKDLREQISAGVYPPGSRLPSNIKLSKHYKVATETIRAAIEELRSAGVVATQSTRGTFVVSEPGTDVQPDLKAVGEEVAELREAVEEYDDLRARVGRIEAILVNLHKRLAIPNPFGGAHDAEEEARGRAARR